VGAVETGQHPAEAGGTLQQRVGRILRQARSHSRGIFLLTRFREAVRRDGLHLAGLLQAAQGAGAETEDEEKLHQARSNKNGVPVPHLPRSQDPHLVQERAAVEELHRPAHLGYHLQPEDWQLQDEAGAIGEGHRVGQVFGLPGNQSYAEAGGRLRQEVSHFCCLKFVNGDC